MTARNSQRLRVTVAFRLKKAWLLHRSFMLQHENHVCMDQRSVNYSLRQEFSSRYVCLVEKNLAQDLTVSQVQGKVLYHLSRHSSNTDGEEM